MPPDLSRFESLGGHGVGCEFGLVQRNRGLEPLGLLRWAMVAPHLLPIMLDHSCAGVGEPENTEVEIVDGEWIFVSRLYHFSIHSFIPEAEMPRDAAFSRACMYLKMLARKFMEDVREARKIFVYRILKENLAEADIRTIHAALRRHGGGSLLYVGYTEPGHPPGSVERLDDGLYYGRIDRFMASRQDDARYPILFDQWEQICARTLEIAGDGRRDASAAVTAAQGPDGHDGRMEGRCLSHD